MERRGIIIPENIRVEFEFGKRVTSDRENNIHWLPINIDDYKITRPTILCFGGVATTNSRDANYIAKMMQRVVHIERDANIISIIHSHIDGERVARYFDEDPEDIFLYGYGDASKIVDAIFVPLVVDKNGDRLMVQEACMNVRDINIFAHCYGHFLMVKYIEEAFKDSLKYLSYNQEEIERILKQIFVLSYEAGCSYKTSFSNVNINSVASEIWEEDVLNFPKRNFDAVVMADDEKYKVLNSEMYKTKDHNLVRECLRNNRYIIAKEGNIIDIYTNPLTTDYSDHDLATIYRHSNGRFDSYTNELGMIVSDTVSSVMRYALNNSEHNKSALWFKPIDMNEVFQKCCDSMKLARTRFGELVEFELE